MLKEIVKKELIKIITKWFTVLFDIEEYERVSGLDEDRLLNDERYIALLDKSSDLRVEVYRQLLNSKCYILDGVEGIEKKLLEIIGESKCFRDGFSGKHIEKTMVKFLDTEQLIAEKSISTRLEELGQLFVSKTTAKSVDNLYKQAVNSYIYGNFDACCIMCRAIVERVLKEACNEKLKTKNSFEKYTLYELIAFCRKFNIVKGHILELAENIRKQGKDSIHSEVLADEKNAIASIREAQSFLRDILNKI